MLKLQLGVSRDVRKYCILVFTIRDDLVRDRQIQYSVI